MTDKTKPKQYVINVALGNDNEPRDVFVGGMSSGDVLITRGKDVTVSSEVLERLDHAVIGVPEPSPDDPSQSIVVERKRFPYSIVGVVA